MRRLSCALTGMLVIFGVMAVDAYAEAIREGKWSMTITTKMEGMDAEMKAAMKEMENMPPEARAMMKNMPGMNMPTMGADGITTTVTQCITSQNPVPDTKVPETCKQTHEIKGSTVTFQVKCKERNMQMESSGSVTYNGDTMKGSVKARQIDHGQSMDMSMTLSGKYLGPCKK